MSLFYVWRLWSIAFWKASNIHHTALFPARSEQTSTVLKESSSLIQTKEAINFNEIKLKISFEKREYDDNGENEAIFAKIEFFCQKKATVYLYHIFENFYKSNKAVGPGSSDALHYTVSTPDTAQCDMTGLNKI